MSVIPLLDAITPIINKFLAFIPDPEQRLKAQMDLLTSLHQWDSDQAQINAAEAANANIFVSGWRPFIGWVCGAAFAYKFVLQPFLVFIIVALGIRFDVDSLPVLDWSEMSTVLLGLLGLGGLRSYEKVKGVSN
jgi:hypothetical protein